MRAPPKRCAARAETQLRTHRGRPGMGQHLVTSWAQDLSGQAAAPSPHRQGRGPCRRHQHVHRGSPGTQCCTFNLRHKQKSSPCTFFFSQLPYPHKENPRKRQKIKGLNRHLLPPMLPMTFVVALGSQASWAAPPAKPARCSAHCAARTAGGAHTSARCLLHAQGTTRTLHCRPGDTKVGACAHTRRRRGAHDTAHNTHTDACRR